MKTARKMSPAGLALIAEVPLDARRPRVLDDALARDVVQRYLAALGRRTTGRRWRPRSPTDVAPGGSVPRRVRRPRAYAAFLRSTLTALSGYELVVERMIADGGTVAVELSETVDDAGDRLRTDEVVVFDVVDGLIAQVAVYLQTSERVPGP